MSIYRVIGLDLSLTRTGIAGHYNGAMWADSLTIANTTGHRRLNLILSWLGEWSADLWVIEGLAYDAYDTDRAGAGLHWIVRHRLWNRCQPYAVIPPKTLKLYATGRGDASKEDMRLAADRRFPDVAVANNDEADALWLCHAGLDRLGEPALRLPAAQRAALDGPKRPRKGKPVPSMWPDLDEIREKAAV